MTHRAEPPARRCLPLVVPPGTAGLEVMMPALRSALDGRGPALAPLPGLGGEEYIDRLREALRPDQPVAPDVAVVAATSGSTGRPAGVLLPASALLAAAESFARRYGGHRWVAALPLHHAGGLMVAVRSVVDGTSPVAVTSLGGAAPFTLEAFAAATAQARRPGRPLAVSLVPAMLARLAATGSPGRAVLAEYDVVLVGGAACPAALVDSLRTAGVPVVTSYGMTETCGGVVFDGRPLDGASVVTRPDGLLVICGPQVAAGYRDHRDAGRWEPQGACAPAGGGAAPGEAPGAAPMLRCFRSDDLGRVHPDGRVAVDGRHDDVVQVAGTSVSVTSVAEILRADARVAAAEVVAVPDGELGTVLVALVVLRGLARTTGPEAGLADSVAAQLGRGARPRAVVVLAELPMLGSGKPDRALLTSLARDALAG